MNQTTRSLASVNSLPISMRSQTARLPIVRIAAAFIASLLLGYRIVAHHFRRSFTSFTPSPFAG